MKVSNPLPAPALAGYVERILVIEHYQVRKPFVLPLFANGMPTLLFQTTNGDINGKSTHYLTFFGQTVFPQTLTIEADFTLVAYFFQPAALHAIFGISAHQLTDLPVSLDMLDGKTAPELEARLLDARSTAAMLALLDEYILRLIRRVQQRRSRTLLRATHAARAVYELRACQSNESLTAVQKKLCLTERTFQRLFKDTIGLSPHLYRRVCQFDSAFQQLNRRQSAKLSDVAFRHGYADQSHYIRAFREFTGTTPGAYLKWAGGS